MWRGVVLVLIAVPAPDGRPAEESFLRTARVASVAPLGEGVTHSSRVELRQGTTTRRAVFKTADLRMEGARYTFGAETVTTYRDTWKHEVAAYLLDKLLDLRLVPPVVERKIEGRKGSLQAWVEKALARFTPTGPPADMRRADEEMHAMRMLDYLVYNTDRHVRNVMFAPDWRPAAIDNSIAFHAFVRPYRPLYRFPRGPVERLRGLDARALEAALKGYLERDEMAALRARRERLLGLVDAAIAARGEPAALFEW